MAHAAEIAADAMALMLGGSSKRKSEEALVAGEVWLKVDDEDEWVLATVVSSDNSEVKLERLHAPEGVERSLTVSSKEYDVLKKVTGDFSRDAVNDDLVQLPDVNDASMLHTLRARFEQDDIYTAIGPVLVAINPYRPVPACSPETYAQLREAATATDRAALPPHVFKISLAAYVGMLNSGTSRGMAQSILISGESGAGKTETNKLCSADLQLEPPGLADKLCGDAAHLLVPVSCVRHAYLCGSRRSGPTCVWTVSCLAELSGGGAAAGPMTEAALESGVLLEAFGNARTVYNNNSSRFGKWCVRSTRGTADSTTSRDLARPPPPRPRPAGARCTLTSILAAASNDEVKKWMRSLNEAIRASGGVVDQSAKLARLAALGGTMTSQTKMAGKKAAAFEQARDLRSISLRSPLFDLPRARPGLRSTAISPRSLLCAAEAAG